MRGGREFDAPTVSSTRSVFSRSECLAPDVTSVARLSEAKERGKGALKSKMSTMSSLRNLFQNVMIQYDNFTHHGDLSSEWDATTNFPTYKRCS